MSYRIKETMVIIAKSKIIDIIILLIGCTDFLPKSQVRCIEKFNRMKKAKNAMTTNIPKIILNIF